MMLMMLMQLFVRGFVRGFRKTAKHFSSVALPLEDRNSGITPIKLTSPFTLAGGSRHSHLGAASLAGGASGVSVFFLREEATVCEYTDSRGGIGVIWGYFGLEEWWW